MRTIIKQDNLIIEVDNKGTTFCCETQLNEKETKETKINPGYIQTLMKQEREWRIKMINETTLVYTRLGKLSECINL